MLEVRVSSAPICHYRRSRRGLTVAAASDSLGAGRERLVPPAVPPDPSSREMNRKRRARFSTFRRPVCSLSFEPTNLVLERLEFVFLSLLLFSNVRSDYVSISIIVRL